MCMMLSKKWPVLFILFPLLQYCSSVATTEKPSFIKVNGTQFEYNNRPYYFTGTNFWYGINLASKGEGGNRTRLLIELNNLRSMGITNLRILALSEDSYIQKTLKPAIQKESNIFNEELLDGLDFLLYEMQRRNMYAVIYLNNYWEWSGGMAVYNKWFPKEKVIDPYSMEDGWKAFMDYSASFYRNEKANEYFKEVIKKIVTRKNKYTEKFYFDDPTIMAWELANEPRAGSLDNGKSNLDNFYKWIDETAEYIHSIDPNHLVTTGSEGTVGSLLDEAVFLKAHGSKNIDYLTFHLWAKNWNWFDANKIEETYSGAEKNAIDYFNDHMKLARQLSKPITLEEFGLPRDFEYCWPGSSTSARDKYYSKIYSVVYDSASAGAPIAGSNFWAWSGYGRGINEDDFWKEDNPFTGDPPHEPQGINSIYDTDFSTIAIIKEFTEKMNKLSISKTIVKNKTVEK